MTFDMYAGDLHQSIDHSIEKLLQSGSDNPEKYPELTKLCSSFYSDPVLTDEQAGRLVHELIEIIAINTEKDSYIIGRAFELLHFFSAVFRNGTKIRCNSD